MNSSRALSHLERHLHGMWYWTAPEPSLACCGRLLYLTVGTLKKREMMCLCVAKLIQKLTTRDLASAESCKMWGHDLRIEPRGTARPKMIYEIQKAEL